MNIFLNNQVQRNRTLLDIMFGRKVQQTKNNKNVQSGRRDTVTISSEAQELSMKKSISGRTRNTSVDSTIDLQKYIDAARESNSVALENAGNEIDVNAVTYTSCSEAFRAALTDKYAKLVAEAKTHSNPEEAVPRPVSRFPVIRHIPIRKSTFMGSIITKAHSIMKRT